MKNFAILISVIVLFAACESAEQNNEIIRLQDEKAELARQSSQKDSIIYTIVQSFNDIENNLAAVKERQGIVTLAASQGNEDDQSRRNKIIEDIQMINQLMDENKKRLDWMNSKINYLSKELKDAGLKMDGLAEMVARLTATVQAKDDEIVALKDDLMAMNTSLDSLALAYDTQSIVVEEQVASLNTGYYCYGTFKELKEKGVITKEGGFIGIGRTEKLMEDFNKKYFTQIDVTESTEIELYTKKAKIITTHPTGSYEFKGDGEDSVDKLVITNSEDFWSASKYLVIIVE